MLTTSTPLPEETTVSDHPSLTDLDRALPFVERHIGLRPADEERMLERLGFDSLEDLMIPSVDRIRDEIEQAMKG